MIIIGAKGFAKEVLEVLHQLNQLDSLMFYDDINVTIPELLYGKFRVLKSIEEAATHFKLVDNRFTIGIGNPVLRKKIANKFEAAGGILSSTISPSALIGSYGNLIGDGCNIMAGAIISNDVTIGNGCIVYFNSILSHDCIVGNFVEISPNATLLGRCKIGSYTQIGANATILPNVTIGQNVIVGAGSVVTKDIPDNCIVVGVPAKISKELAPLTF